MSAGSPLASGVPARAAASEYVRMSSRRRSGGGRIGVRFRDKNGVAALDSSCDAAVEARARSGISGSGLNQGSHFIE